MHLFTVSQRVLLVASVAAAAAPTLIKWQQGACCTECSRVMFQNVFISPLFVFCAAENKLVNGGEIETGTK